MKTLEEIYKEADKEMEANPYNQNTINSVIRYYFAAGYNKGFLEGVDEVAIRMNKKTKIDKQ